MYYAYMGVPLGRHAAAYGVFHLRRRLAWGRGEFVRMMDKLAPTSAVPLTAGIYFHGKGTARGWQGALCKHSAWLSFVHYNSTPMSRYKTAPRSFVDMLPAAYANVDHENGES
jgi:hypothetical protein